MSSGSATVSQKTSQGSGAARGLDPALAGRRGGGWGGGRGLGHEALGTAGVRARQGPDPSGRWLPSLTSGSARPALCPLAPGSGLRAPDSSAPLPSQGWGLRRLL